MFRFLELLYRLGVLALLSAFLYVTWPVWAFVAEAVKGFAGWLL